MMKEIKCPTCGAPIKIDIAKAIDMEGEVFICKNCGKTIRYTDK